MGWVNPSTWVDASQVTKGQFADWNNSVAAAGDHTAWSTWAPTLTAPLGIGETLNPPISYGGGGVSGRKIRLGQIGVAAFRLSWGSTGSGGTITASPAAPTVPYRLTLPWPAAGTGMPCGSGYLYDANADNTYLMTAYVNTSTCVSFRLTWNGSSMSPAHWCIYRQDGGGARYVPTQVYSGAQAAGLIAYRIA